MFLELATRRIRTLRANWRVCGATTHAWPGGYRHTLHLSLDGVENAELNLKRFDENGALKFSSTNTIAQFQDVMILPASNTTHPQWNTRRGGAGLRPGKRASFEIVPQTPMNTTSPGKMPFDLFLKVIDTNREIRFLGRYFETDGRDRYLDSAGFPRALLVPGDWRWPYKRQDIRPAYPEFEAWYTSGGKLNVDWYTDADDAFVLPGL